MLVVVLLAFAGAGGAIAYLTAPVAVRCEDMLPGVASSCVAAGATPGRIAFGALAGLLVPLLVVCGRRLVP